MLKVGAQKHHTFATNQTQVYFSPILFDYVVFVYAKILYVFISQIKVPPPGPLTPWHHGPGPEISSGEDVQKISPPSGASTLLGVKKKKKKEPWLNCQMRILKLPVTCIPPPPLVVDRANAPLTGEVPKIAENVSSTSQKQVNNNKCNDEKGFI